MNTDRFIQLTENIDKKFNELRDKCYRLERENFCPGTQGECISARNTYFEIENMIKELKTLIPERPKKSHLQSLLSSSCEEPDDRTNQIIDAMIADFNEIIERFNSYDDIMVHVHKWAITPRQNYNPASGRICVHRYK